MKLRTFLASLAVLVFSTSVAFADSKFNQVKPGEFDPAKSILVQAAWLNGTGCPTSQQIQQYKAVPPYRLEIVIYQDPGCPTGDSKDKKNEGLLLVKTGPTANNAAAGAELKGVKGMTLTELGYDIRKPGAAVDPRGSLRVDQVTVPAPSSACLRRAIRSAARAGAGRATKGRSRNGQLYLT